MHLEIKNLVKFYKKELPIIKKLNFSVNKGNIISFIGESGSGKTTLLKCISGLEKINSGSILLNGKILNVSVSLSTITCSDGKIRQEWGKQDGSNLY